MNICKQCGNTTHNPKFCCKSCSATYTNKFKNKRTKVCRSCTTLICSQYTYCSDCWNSNKHLEFLQQRKNTSKFDADTVICNKCKIAKPITEYYRKTNGGYQSYCRSCNSKNSSERQRDFKQSCVDYKGGKCEICGYNKCIEAFDFHHINPKEKDFTIAHLRWTSWLKNKDKITSELNKCMLLCANCHREMHAGIITQI